MLHQAENILRAKQEVLRKAFSIKEIDAFTVLLQRFEAAFQDPKGRRP